MLSAKKCTKCKVEKPRSAFAPRLNVSHGMASWCRRCTNEQNNGPDNRKSRQNRFAGKQRLVALKGGKCERCHGVFPPYVYDLHHRDPHTKEMYLSNLCDKKWERVIKEAAKCDLLCSNCHRIVHAEIRTAGKP